MGSFVQLAPTPREDEKIEVQSIGSTDHFGSGWPTHPSVRQLYQLVTTQTIWARWQGCQISTQNQRVKNS